MRLDSGEREALVAVAKRQLRSRMKALRSSMPERALRRRSDAVVRRVTELPAWKAARAVALFAPMPGHGEVDVTSLDAIARRDGRRVFYPGYRGEPLRPAFCEATLDDLAERGRGFAEPVDAARAAGPGEVDLAVVPALAIDTACRRLGFGSGYYDEILSSEAKPTRSVVVAFHFQLIGELPHLPHDQASDFAVTDETTIARPS